MSFFYKKNTCLEKMVEQYFKAISEYNDEQFSGKLTVILLGSLSRGEGSWVETQGGPQILSDIEYFTVYPNGFDAFSEYSEFCKNLAKQIFKGQESSLFHIDNTFVLRDALPRMERKLITYDAKQMGKNIVGKNGGVELIPEINLKNINMRDIKEILTHRIFSVLYYGLPLKNKGNIEEYKYSLAKNSLDLMTVMLVSRGILESGFVNRLNIIKTLQIDGKIKNYFEYCLSVKLSLEYKYVFSIEEMEEIFLTLVRNLNKEFKVPIRNIFVNFRYVSKRNMGKIKRAIKYNHIPSINHMNKMIMLYNKKLNLTNKVLKDNLVLHGYPVL